MMPLVLLSTINKFAHELVTSTFAKNSKFKTENANDQQYLAHVGLSYIANYCLFQIEFKIEHNKARDLTVLSYFIQDGRRFCFCCPFKHI